MSDGDKLLRQIIETPEDDNVRLVYADYLQENGQTDRAEFIRVQIEHLKGRGWLTVNGAGFYWCPRCLYSSDPRSSWQKAYGPENMLNTCRECHNTRTREKALSGNCSFAGWLDYKTFNGWTVLVGDQPNTYGAHAYVRWRRGFVDEIGCTVRMLFDTRCNECRGTGNYLGMSTESNPGSCPRCGEGRTRGVAEYAFANHPITKVKLRRKVPLEHVATVYEEITDTDRSITDWSWVRDHGYTDEIGTQILPVELWEELTDYDTSPSSRVFARRYPTAKAAYDALEAACIRLGRKSSVGWS